VAENGVHVHDFHATILHLIGIDHTKLTYRHAGRDYRLTDVHDLHATILHQMGIDHTKLTYRHAGRDFRLTDVHGKIVREILV
jgi:hypothetical protein